MLSGTDLLLIILLALLFIVIACSVLRWHPFPVLLLTALLLALLVGIPGAKTLQVVMTGAGQVFSGIGFIIALGTILGLLLERTGAATTLARAVVKGAGRRSVLPGMSLLGALVGIPVFCDSGFVILSNLGRSLALESGQSFGAISMALATGLYSTHVLVPPTPGPLAAAGNLGMSDQLGWVMLLGMLLSLPALLAGLLMARRFREPLPQREFNSGNITDDSSPGLFAALFPILLPVFLIGLGTLLPWCPLPPGWKDILLFICNPTVSLLLAVACALLLTARSFRAEWSKWIQEALAQAGPIILITVAGGALGAVLKATGLEQVLSGWVKIHGFSEKWFYPVAFLLAAGLKTAQGSSTAALVIASSVMASLIPAHSFSDPFPRALLVLSIGAGGMTVSHANDSYFWVISQYAGIPVKDMYRHFTLSSLLMGLSVLGGCLLLSLLA